LICDVPITDAGLKWLYGLKRLSQVTLEYTNVTPVAVAELRKAFPTCRIDYSPPAHGDRASMLTDDRD
jgi:hypothetical protein